MIEKWKLLGKFNQVFVVDGQKVLSFPQLLEVGSAKIW